MIFLDHCLDDSPIKSVSFSFHFYIHRLHRRHCPPLSRRNKNKLTFLDYQFRHSFLQVRFTHLIVPLHLFSAPVFIDLIASVVSVIRSIDRRFECRWPIEYASDPSRFTQNLLTRHRARCFFEEIAWK